jgi:hypothetical protein
MHKVDRGRKKKLVRISPIMFEVEHQKMDLLDEVTNVVALDVDVFGLRDGHVVDNEGDAALGVFVGDSRA